MHRYKPSTAGEALFLYIYRALEDDRAWRYLTDTIRPIGHCDKLALYYRQHAALHLTCKLIAAGRSVYQVEEENTALLSTLVERFPWNRINSGNRLTRLLSTAVLKADRQISPGVKKSMRAFAREKHGRCYICGMSLDFDNEGSAYSYTAEHLWPSSFGGDSVEENLLPACWTCNNAKGSMAFWISTDLHSVYLGMNPPLEKLKKLEFKRRYALFQRAAMSLAMQRETTLRNAFLRLGSWTETRVHDEDLSVDMFNLKTHQDVEDLELYESV